MNYYYLVSSLPALHFEEPPALSFEVFRSLCRDHLAPRDMAALDELAADSPEPPQHEAVAKWKDKDAQLRNALARFRADRLHRDESEFLRPHAGFDVRVERVAAEAYGKASPLEREALLDRFRWAMAEEIAGINPFSAAAVVAYALRLQIAGRWAALNDGDGMKAADRIASRTASSQAGRDDAQS